MAGEALSVCNQGSGSSQFFHVPDIPAAPYEAFIEQQEWGRHKQKKKGKHTTLFFLSLLYFTSHSTNDHTFSLPSPFSASSFRVPFLFLFMFCPASPSSSDF
jgi:hypothetical protein